jgi:cyclic pyranopterin phosphate synthase
MPAEGVPKIAHKDLLSLEQLAELVAWLAVRVGIERVKLTGGEPLVRLGVEQLVAHLAGTPGVREVSLTTNGSLLPQMAGALKAAGLRRVNISLDSLDPARFTELTRGARLPQTLAGIEAALAVGLVPLKLNAVLQRSSWKQDVPLLLDYAANLGLELRFIELMRTGTEQAWCASEFVPVQEVRHWLEERGPMQEMPAAAGAPARRTKICWRGAPLTVGWIAPRSHPFCSRCERVRLDARGRLRRCLMDPVPLDLFTVLRERGDEGAAMALSNYMAGKFAPQTMDSAFAMSSIGG